MKDNNIYTYDIAAIILAYLRDEMDEEDQRKLEEWLKKSESHQVLLSRIRDEKMQYEDIRKILSYNANSAWLLVRQKATRKRRKTDVCDLSGCSFDRGCFGRVCYVVDEKRQTGGD